MNNNGFGQKTIRTPKTFDFTKIPRRKEIGFAFFPAALTDDLAHFLEEQLVTGWEIISIKTVRELFPHVEIPTDVRLRPDLRIEKNIRCFVSYMDPDAARDEILKIFESPESVERAKRKSEQALREQAYRDAWAKDPSPLDFIRALNGQD